MNYESFSKFVNNVAVQRTDTTMTQHESMVTAIVFSGITYKQAADFAKHLNLQFISSQCYCKIQTKIIFPVVDEAWRNQAAVLK